jgi:hypothetical protein
MRPVLPPDGASYRGAGRGGARIKKYLQCAQRAGLLGGSDAHSIGEQGPVALARSL